MKLFAKFNRYIMFLKNLVALAIFDDSVKNIIANEFTATFDDEKVGASDDD